MPAPEPNSTPVFQLYPGVSYYMVLEPSTVLAADGSSTYAMTGPFADLASASYRAAKSPGSLISVTLILHQATPAAPASVMPGVTPMKRKG